MKQLINKFDRQVRLVGLEEVQIYGDTGTTKDDKPRLYFRFPMPTAVGMVDCAWSSAAWELADYELRQETEQGECPEFCKWLKATLKEKNYTLSGVSRYLGFSSNWLWSIVSGKRRLPEKRHADLEKAIGLRRGEIARQLKRCTKPSPNPTI